MWNCPREAHATRLLHENLAGAYINIQILKSEVDYMTVEDYKEIRQRFGGWCLCCGLSFFAAGICAGTKVHTSGAFMHSRIFRLCCRWN